MKLYQYDGPVMKFDICIQNNWRGSTYADSERKARSNLTYQFKKKYQLTPGTRITLPGQLIIGGEHGRV